MTVSEIAQAQLRSSARRAYEWGRLQGALRLGAVAAIVAMPGFLACNRNSVGATCLAGFAFVVAAGRMRGEAWEAGTRAGALAGILPCLLPATIGLFGPSVCALVSAQGAWICGAGGAAAGIVLGLLGARTHGGDRLPFWSSALCALAFPASLGCLAAGEAGFVGLTIGLLAGGVPTLVSRRASLG